MTGPNPEGPTGKPLAGRKIVVTRTRQQAGGLTGALRELGAEVIELPTIEIVPPDSYEPLDAALTALGRYQWLVATSINGVQVMRDRLYALGLDSEHLAGVKIAAIGPSTAQALETLGLVVALTPPQYVAESLVDAMSGLVAGARVLLVRAASARDVIPEGLARFGAIVDAVDAYRNVVPRGAVAGIQALFADPTPPDAVTFTSSSTVTHFFQLLREARIGLIPAGVRALSIGPITSATLRSHGWEPASEAVQHDVDGLVETAVRALKR